MSAAAGSRKTVRSASAIVAAKESGQHLLKIDGYSRTKDELPTGSDVKSRPFRVGGHSWYIRYYPNSDTSENAGSISVYLALDHNVTKGVRARYKFSLLDRARRPSYSKSSGPDVFLSSGWGWRAFISRDELEKSEYLRDDCFTIMRWRPRTSTSPPQHHAPPAPPPPAVVVPPSDLRQHLGGLLATGEGADVTFEVDGETFAAHRWVLAARSPVFRAELLGPEKNAGAAVVRVDDMEAQDFVALLCYMYTDCLPERDGGEAAAMLPDLVAAAGRYKMERLRLVCEQRLCEYVNARTVVAMLAFAEEHRCNGLKEKCLRFLDDPVKVREIVRAEGLENLIKNHPSVLKDVIAKLAAS
uniref:BTB domain-containing protein n=1 Tax=Oryza brachyantha TaxID=4533 RepID=J3LY04_ORYBR